MKEKLLTERQQLGIFNCADPVALLREYVSFSEDIKIAAEYKDVRTNYKRDPSNTAMLQRLQELNPNERQKECVNNLSATDVTEIYRNGGHIYPEVFLKMLDVFPKEISKEILLQYVKYCEINNAVCIKALEVLGKDAKDIILPKLHLTIDMFNLILKIFSKKEVKEILITMAGGYDSHIEDDDVELKILKVFPDEDLKDILRAFVSGLPWMSEECFLKIFDVCTPAETKELLEIAIKNDMDLWRPTLRKIVAYFPKHEAHELIEAFWKTSPGRNCYTFERTEIAKLLNKKK